LRRRGVWIAVSNRRWIRPCGTANGRAGATRSAACARPKRRAV